MKKNYNTLGYKFKSMVIFVTILIYFHNLLEINMNNNSLHSLYYHEI